MLNMIEKHQHLQEQILPLPISNISLLIKSISNKGVHFSLGTICILTFPESYWNCLVLDAV